MHHGTQRLILGFRVAAICLAASAAVSCVSIDPGSFLPEPGYYYGVGSGPSTAEAAEAAKRDLIANALSASRDRRGTRGARIELSAEAARGFELPRLRPYAREKAVDSFSIAYRMKIADWEEIEGTREDGIRADLAPRIQALEVGTVGTLAERMREAARLLGQLKEEGLTELLTEAGPGTSLVSLAIESICRAQVESLTFTVVPPGGFLEGSSTLSVRVATRDGSSPGSLAIRAGWTAKDVEPALVFVTTDTEGVARLELPSGEAFRNRAVRLAVSTNLSAAAPFSRGLRAVDDGSTVEYRYRHFDDVRAWFSAQARVPAGPFTAGAPARDRRASRKEAPRTAETREFLIDRLPVTNALYGMFLDDTRSGSFPEYWDNPAYNQDGQPVIGVTWEDANRFAAWLSERLGIVKRLPTEDEWEKAARAGQDVIYPWGDQSPAEGARANFGGNGRFAAPSPVGSFAAGANAYGLLDMAGNVWQWTSTASDAGAGAGAATMIVKGGSWMDGPTDLRISNRRDVDPVQGYVDVGFRLVTEVSDD